MRRSDLEIRAANLLGLLDGRLGQGLTDGQRNRLAVKQAEGLLWGLQEGPVEEGPRHILAGIESRNRKPASKPAS